MIPSDIDIILSKPIDPEYSLLATKEESIEYVKILKSSVVDPSLDFFFIHSNIEEEYTHFLNKIYNSHKHKPNKLIHDIYYSTDLFISTKQLIWILFYSFLQLSDKTFEMKENYDNIFDKLSLNFYTFRSMLLEDSSNASKAFNKNWSILTLCVWFSVFFKEFPDTKFMNSFQFIKQSENIIQQLLVGFISDIQEMHETIKSYFDDQSFFEKEQTKLSIPQRELQLEINKKYYQREKMINRNRVLFKSTDNNPLLTRAFELKGLKRVNDVMKSERRNQGPTVMFHHFKDQKHLEIRADASKDRMNKLHSDHAKSMHKMMRNICYEEAKFEDYVENRQEKLNGILTNKEDTKLRAAKLVDSYLKNKK